MECTTSKSEVIKPVILKAGIPLALSLVGLVYAKIMARKGLPRDPSSESQSNCSETNSNEELKREERFASLASSSVLDDRSNTMGNHILGISDAVRREKASFGEENTSFTSQIKDLQMRELELNWQFKRFCELKERESMLIERRNTIALNAFQTGFLEQLEHFKSENELLQRKVRKLVNRTRKQSCLIKEQNVKIISREERSLTNHVTLETMDGVIKNLEIEVRELQSRLSQLQEEKNDLLLKLDLKEKSCPVEVEAKGIAEEDYRLLANELERVQKERANDVDELIYLRWIHARLKHEILRNHEQQHEQPHEGRGHLDINFERSGEMIHYGSEHELDEDTSLEHKDPSFGVVHGDHPKRRKLLRRLRKWVEGGERSRGRVSDKERIKCSRRDSVSDRTGEHNDHPRRSCSSV